MKKIIYILMLVLAVTLLVCGCGAKDLSEACVASADGMPEIYINMEGEPGEEYTEACVRVNEKRSASVSVDTDMDLNTGSTENFTAEVKLRGNSSKESAKKAYTIKLEEELSLFGMDTGRKWALISNPFDKSLLRPAVGFDYAKALGLAYVPETELCKVWLNDTYMGVYTAMEPVEAGEGRVEIDPDDGDFLLERNMNRFEEDKVYIDSPAGLRFEFNEPEEPDDKQIAQCYDLLMKAEEAIFSGDYDRCIQFIDVESFVNFYIFHELIKDVDFGEYSTRYYFKEGLMYAGPPWDLDLTMGNVAVDKEEFKYASYNNVDGAGDVVYQVWSGAGVHNSDAETTLKGSAHGMWAASGDYYYWLIREPWFMELVQQRWLAVRDATENLTVDNELGQNLIDRYLTMYLGGFESNFETGGIGSQVSSEQMQQADTDENRACWSISEPAHMSEWQQPAETYLENVEMLREWLVERAAYLDSQWGPFVYTPMLAVQ